MGKKRTISETEDSATKSAYDKICQEEERLSKLLFGDVNEVIRTDPVDESENNVPETSKSNAWEDEDDQTITVRSALKAQKRNLPDGGVNDKQNTYDSLLKHKYRNVVGTPKWAKLETKEYDSDEEILQSCGHIASGSRGNALQKGLLEYKQVMDLNAETYTEGPFIHSLQFHPTATVGLVAGPSAIFSLFAVDGKRNNKIHSVKLDKFPIKCAKFNQNGKEIVFGSSRHAYMNVYDLEKAESQRIFLPHEMTNMQRFEISPCGRFISVAGRFGDLFLLDAKSKEKIGSFRQNSKVRAMAFTPDGDNLYAHSQEGKVAVWDVRMQRIVNQWFDEGCIQGSNIDISPCGKFVATGSFEGVVNLYDRQTLTVENPTPIKAVMNLTTCITGLQFNAASEILAFSSLEKDGAVKLLHVNSQTVFSNFPGMNSKLHKINSVAFSPLSGYFAAGNNRSKVLLYRLKHYANY